MAQSSDQVSANVTVSPLTSSPSTFLLDGPMTSHTSSSSWPEPRSGRVRRFVYFPEGSSITVTVDFVIPIGYSGATFTISPAITFSPTTVSHKNKKNEHGDDSSEEEEEEEEEEENDYRQYHQGRSFAADQRKLFATISDGFTQAGLNGPACLRRLLCEAASAPRHQDGLLGEVVNAVLLHDDRSEGDEVINEVDTGGEPLPSNVTQPETDFRRLHYRWQDSDELAEARRLGALHGDCAARFGSCPVSVFSML